MEVVNLCNATRMIAETAYKSTCEFGKVPELTPRDEVCPPWEKVESWAKAVPQGRTHTPSYTLDMVRRQSIFYF
jgi:hypothetical protein